MQSALTLEQLQQQSQATLACGLFLPVANRDSFSKVIPGPAYGAGTDDRVQGGLPYCAPRGGLALHSENRKQPYDRGSFAVLVVG
jgi:hypothetical protein